MADCPFCRRITERNYTPVGGLVVAFEPLNPVTPGHLLVVPRLHVPDALRDPDVTAYTMRAAADLAGAWTSLNIITSVGAPATQTVSHFHVHLVPRVHGDGLALPWTGQAHRG